MSRYHNDAGEPLMTAAATRLEADIDAHAASEPMDHHDQEDAERRGSRECQRCGELAHHTRGDYVEGHGWVCCVCERELES